MEKKSKKYTRYGCLAVILSGIILHYLYDLSSRSPWIGLFAPVNESVWEHMKLVFFPLTAYFLFEIIRLGKKIPALSAASARGILAGTFMIPVLFYTYTGILGRHILAVDIVLFLLGILLGFYVQGRIVRRQAFHALPSADDPFVPWGLTVLTCLCFFLFSFRPPDLPLFSPF